MRVQLVDPAAFTPPYDHGLAAALARAGADVELVTSAYPYGRIPPVDGFERSERFLRRTRTAARPLRALEHAADMLRYRPHARAADVVHWQWLPIEPLDSLLMPPAARTVLTLHNVRRRGDGRVLGAVTRRLIDRADAVVVHTRDALEHLREWIDVDDEERLRVIPHGALDYLTRLPDERPLPPELAAVEKPVLLCFGSVRDYKGVDVMLRAFALLDADAAELWVVGKPDIALEPLRALAARAPGTVRFVDRFVEDAEVPAYFRRADLVVLPYRRIDQSGVLYTALAFGKPIVVSAVGGFRELAEDHGAAALVPPEDPAALADTVIELLGGPAARARLAERAAAAAAGPFSWDAIARSTLTLYEELTA